jgi:hypothetical protein
MINRLALRFHDERHPEYIEHEIATARSTGVRDRVGYEDINNH